jgi:hypothetical protein
MYIQASPFEIETKTHERIRKSGRDVTAFHRASVITQQNSSTSMSFLSPKEKSRRAFQNRYYLNFLTFFLSQWSLKLRKSGSVCASLRMIWWSVSTQLERNVEEGDSLILGCHCPEVLRKIIKTVAIHTAILCAWTARNWKFLLQVVHFHSHIIPQAIQVTLHQNGRSLHKITNGILRNALIVLETRIIKCKLVERSPPYLIARKCVEAIWATFIGGVQLN